MAHVVPIRQREKDVLSWVGQAVVEGDAFLRGQFGYKDIDKGIKYIQGEQSTKLQRSDLSSLSVNLLGKAIGDNVAALTDLKPFFSYKSANELFKPQAMILNQLSQSWWLNNFIDLKIGAAVQLAMPAGCAYLHLVWNPELQGGLGDLDLIPRDARDVIPIRPTTSMSIQDSMGVIIRSKETVSFLKAKYPHLADFITPDQDVAFGTGRHITSHVFDRMIAPILTRLGKAGGKGMAVPGVEVFTVHVKDDQFNESSSPVHMGLDHEGKETKWSYVVEPKKPLYPRGRTIICSKKKVFYDGPNVWWFDMFPIVKLFNDMSFVYPNSYFSKSLTQDLIPLNDFINNVIRGVDDNIKKDLRPNKIADSRVISQKELNKYDTRGSGQSVRMRFLGGQGIQFEGGADLKKYVFDMLEWMVDKMDLISGSRDLSSMSRLRQLPSQESIEAISAGMSPQLRMRGRLLEFAVREIAHLVKFGFLQHYTAKRRMAVLGPGGLTLEDFDFDPNTLVPDGEGDIVDSDGNKQNFTDFAGLNRTDRAIKHASNFTFYVTPNSMLELQLLPKKAEAIMLRRMGDIDHETLLELLEVPNIPQIATRLVSELDQKIALIQQETAGTPGRKPTAQKSPAIETKGDGRPIISES